MDPIEARKLPILCLDFDGVIHHYRRGWQDGTIYDTATPGFFDWAARAKDYFRLVVYSSRSATPEGIRAMMEWMTTQYYANGGTDPSAVHDWFTFADKKPPAFATIDDRAIRFEGDWASRYLQPDRIRRFRTWTEVDAPQPPLVKPVPMTPRLVRVSDVVLFCSDDLEIMPAIVTKVVRPTLVNLQVLPDMSSPFPASGVIHSPFPSGVSPDTLAQRTWSPPYGLWAAM